LPRTSAAPILAAFASLAVSSPARADDLTIVFRMTEKGAERVATHYFTAALSRFDQGDRATIVDFATGRVVNIHMKKKQYSETTFGEIEQAMSSMSSQMEKALAGIPEGLRNQMMGDASREVTITSGETRTIAGVACQNYIVTLGETMRMETCATTAIKPPFDPANFRNLTLATSPIGPASSGINRMVEKMRAIEGISIASSNSLSMLGKTVENSMEATEIRRGPIDASTFDVPPGLKKVDSPWH